MRVWGLTRTNFSLSFTESSAFGLVQCAGSLALTSSPAPSQAPALKALLS